MGTAAEIAGQVAISVGACGGGGQPHMFDTPAPPQTYTPEHTPQFTVREFPPRELMKPISSSSILPIWHLIASVLQFNKNVNDNFLEKNSTKVLESFQALVELLHR
jgi:hypothetical protein